MSLMDKSINFDSTILGLATAIYDIIKPIFKDAVLDTDNTTVYFDSNKRDGLKISDGFIAITYIIQNNKYTYNYRDSYISSFSKLYYNISANKDMFAFGFTPGVLDFGFGYEESIGFWEFRMGVVRATSDVPKGVNLYIQDKNIYKNQSTDQGYDTRWFTTNTHFNVSLIQLPLFVTSGNFNSLFEVISCHTSYSFNRGTVIVSKNKYYRLLQSYDYTSAAVSSVILAMEVADD